MATSFVGATHPLPYVPDSAVRGGSKARADIISEMAGRERFLAEFLDGTTAAGSEPCAPRNGLGGTTSHDHTGGVGGTPIHHSFGWFTFGNSDSGVGVLNHITNGDAIWMGVDNNVPADGVYGTPRVIFDGPITVFCPPSSTIPTPYYNGLAGAYHNVGFSVTVTASSACSIRFDVKNQGVTTTWSQTLAFGKTHCLSTDSDRTVVMKPGYINTVSLKITMSYTSASTGVGLMSGAFHQIRTRAGP